MVVAGTALGCSSALLLNRTSGLRLLAGGLDGKCINVPPALIIIDDFVYQTTESIIVLVRVTFLEPVIVLQLRFQELAAAKLLDKHALKIALTKRRS